MGIIVLWRQYIIVHCRSRISIYQTNNILNYSNRYTNNKCFSEKGIELLISYFSKRGHKVKVFLPQYRRARCYPLLEKWYEEGIVVFTPSRKLGNKSYTPYDDR